MLRLSSFSFFSKGILVKGKKTEKRFIHLVHIIKPCAYLMCASLIKLMMCQCRELKNIRPSGNQMQGVFRSVWSHATTVSLHEYRVWAGRKSAPALFLHNIFHYDSTTVQNNPCWVNNVKNDLHWCCLIKHIPIVTFLRLKCQE